MPRIPYKNKDGKRLPGVTTIAGAFKPSIEGLLIWANRLGQDGKTLEEGRDSATEPGTCVHAMIEAYLRGLDPHEVEKQYPPDVVDKASNAFLNFLTWAETHKLKPVAIEPNLISEAHQYGGTPDLIAEMNGKLSLVDWKSGRVYEHVLLQLAAYREAWFENNGGSRIEGFHVLQIPRNEEIPSFTHRYWESLPEEAFPTFLKLRECYESFKILKKFIS